LSPSQLSLRSAACRDIVACTAIAESAGRDTVSGMERDDLRTANGLTVPSHALRWEFARGSGPGGQHVNTTSSRATLVLDLTALQGPAEVRSRVVARLGESLRVSASSSRSQWQNRRSARALALVRLEEAARVEPARTPTVPSAASRRRRLIDKRRRGEVKASRRGDVD